MRPDQHAEFTRPDSEHLPEFWEFVAPKFSETERKQLDTFYRGGAVPPEQLRRLLKRLHDYAKPHEEAAAAEVRSAAYRKAVQAERSALRTDIKVMLHLLGVNQGYARPRTPPLNAKGDQRPVNWEEYRSMCWELRFGFDDKVSHRDKAKSRLSRVGAFAVPSTSDNVRTYRCGPHNA